MSQLPSRFENSWYKNTHWPTSLFMILNPAFGIFGTIWAVQAGHFTWPLFVFSTFFGVLNNLAVTAGYHRLYSHRSYQTNAFVEWIYLLIGASAWQGSVLKWSSDHRRHHMNIDTEKDPYNIQYGFWYAHMGWLFRKDSVDLEITGVQDLLKNPRVVFQHKYYYQLAILTSYGIPGLFGWFLGSFWAGIFVGACLRITLSQQSTFFVNSLSHSLGGRPYDKDISARDSIIVAVLTHGEGYHNFHHKFQFDYRNGIKWYHWDPTKWVILALKNMGLATKLKEVSAADILKARLEVEGEQLKTYGWSQEKVEQIRHRILIAQQNIRQMIEEYEKLKSQALKTRDQSLENFKLEIRRAQREFKMAKRNWNLMLRNPQLVFALHS